MSRYVKRHGPAPIDPRSRLVVKMDHRGGCQVLELECGHTLRRRCHAMPERIICTLCPAAGGLGGRVFDVGR